MNSVTVRSATGRDAAALLEIYAPVVRDSAASFELEPPPVAEFQDRVEKSLRQWAWLVAECGDRLVGYAYATPHRARAAYRWSVETSVYIDESSRGAGVGRLLYQTLLPRLAEMGYCNAYAGITMPNEASTRLHHGAGFRHIGLFPAVGRKFHRWHDVSWWHCKLREAPLDE